LIGSLEEAEKKAVEFRGVGLGWGGADAGAGGVDGRRICRG